MKELKRISMRRVSEVLSDKEMRLYVGGYDECGYDAAARPCFFGCPNGYECDWFYLTCVKKQTGPYPKIAACEGKKEGDDCSFQNDYGVTCYGKCFGSKNGLVEFHCSDTPFL